MSILCDLGFVLSLTYLKRESILIVKKRIYVKHQIVFTYLFYAYMNTAKKMSRPIISKKKLSELQGKDNGSSTSTAQSDNKSIPAASSQTTAESIKEGEI